MEIQIDKEFQKLIPQLTNEERTGLEQNLLANGCLDPLKVWRGTNILIDGHNRFSICQAHNLPFDTQEIEFDSRDDVNVWIIRNQFDRRNIPIYVRATLALQLESIYKVKAHENKVKAGKLYGENHKKEEVLSNSTKPLDTRKELAKTAKVGSNTILRVKKIQEKAPEEVKDKLNKGEMSINEAYKTVKREEQKEKRRQVALDLQTEATQVEDLATIETKYRVVYADPPWTYGNDQTQAMPGSTRPEDHYTAMSLQDICDLPVRRITQEHAVLFLWVTSPLLEESFKVIHAWGFKYKTSFIWDKVKHNFGHYNSVRHEFLLIATKGSCTPDNKKLHDSVLSIERTDHSRKPEEFRVIIDELYEVGNRIELFSRTNIEGWDTWGNQTQ